MDSGGNFPKRDKRVAYSGAGLQKAGRQSSKNRPVAKKKGVRRKNPPTKGPSRRKLQMIIGCAIALAALLIVFAATKKDGAEVMVGQQAVGIVKDSKVKAEDITNTVTAQLEADTGTKIQLNETITVKPIHIPGNRKKEVGTLDYILPKIREAVTYQVEAGVIMVQNEKAAVLANVTQANEVLEEIKAPYNPEDIEMEVTFVETVTAVSQFVDSSEIITKEMALSKLQDSTEIKKTYTVVSGDTLSSIAKKVEMSMDELLKVNPGMSVSSSLQIGQVINILAKKPFVSVKTIETVVLTEVEEKPYEYRQDSTKNKGYQKVVQQGRAGQKESTKQIIRINGFVEEEKEISKKVTVEPVTEIIVQGTK